MQVLSRHRLITLPDDIPELISQTMTATAQQDFCETREGALFNCNRFIGNETEESRFLGPGSIEYISRDTHFEDQEFPDVKQLSSITVGQNGEPRTE